MCIIKKQCPYCGVIYTIEGDKQMSERFAKYIEYECINPLCIGCKNKYEVAAQTEEAEIIKGEQ